jgi:hypothetical protein
MINNLSFINSFSLERWAGLKLGTSRRYKDIF